MKTFIRITIFGSLFILLGCSSNNTLSLANKEQSCNNKNPQHCSAVADYYMKKKEYQKAIKYAKIGCDSNQARGCEILGMTYLDGNEVKKNIKEGLKLLEKSCSISDGDVGCFDLAVRYSVIGFGIHKNYTKASEYFKKACEKGLHAQSCYYLAFNYENGRGIQKNDGLSVQYYRKALGIYEKDCKKNNFKACNAIGEQYVYGKGVSLSLKKALEYYHIGCDQNDGSSCFKVGMMYHLATGFDQEQGRLIENTMKAKKYYLKACDNKYILGCETFAKLNK